MALIIAEILLSLFAVFGLYAAVRLLVFCTVREAKNLIVAFEIDGATPPSAWQIRLFNAREQAAFFPGHRVVALVDEQLEGHKQITLFLESVGVPYYYVKIQKEGE